MATISSKHKRRIALFNNADIIVFHAFIDDDLTDYWLDRLILEAKDTFSRYQHLTFNEYAHVGTRVISKVERPAGDNWIWDANNFTWVEANVK